MLSKEIREYISKLDLCDICIHRYEYAEYECIEKTFSEYRNKTAVDEIKRSKLNTCAACLGIFKELDKVAGEIAENSNLSSYECTSLYSSVQTPINLLIRDLSLWIDLIERFPGEIDEYKPPFLSIKDVFKYLFNKILCSATNRTVEQNQNGILVNLFFSHDLENEEIEKLSAVKPSSLVTSCAGKKKNIPNMTRNLFEKHYFPSNLDFGEVKRFVAVPPESSSIPIKFLRFSISGPAAFVAGKYRKLSRDLSQTPWLINGKRMKEDSIQELIFHKVCPFFGVSNENTTFMGSGREDIDVRCLGKGRPFALQLLDSKRCTMPRKDAAEMEVNIDMSKKISVQHLQLVQREDLAHIKAGEEQKKKFYRALCILETPATTETIRKLDIPNSFIVHQKTPLRVLHRRPLLTRPREIFSVKGSIYKENSKIVVIDIVTQAGAYIKELIHGEFGRTQPSVSTILGQKIDIVALDVNAIDLNWPNEVENHIN